MSFVFGIHELALVVIIIVLLFIILYRSKEKYKHEMLDWQLKYIRRHEDDNDEIYEIKTASSLETLQTTKCNEVLFVNDIGKKKLIIYKDNYSRICVDVLDIRTGEKKLRDLQSNRTFPPRPSSL